MPSEVVLCQELGTTVSQLRQWLDAREKVKIADFLKHRFEERYFNPILSLQKEKKNGFLIMAISCLTLEALECLRKGWPSSNGRSKLVFTDFLTREQSFSAFRSHAELFYLHVRCGILHQAETDGGWKISRTGPLFEPISLTVNATRFHAELHEVMGKYMKELSSADFDSPIWTCAKTKLESIITNC